MAGILGAGFILIAAGLFMVADDFSGWSSSSRLLCAAGVLAFATAILGAWLRWFAGRFFTSMFTLKATSGGRTLQQSVPVGEQGVAVTALRPLGRAEIGGRLYDVRCQLGQAAAGARVEVLAAEPGNLLVRLL